MTDNGGHIVEPYTPLALHKWEYIVMGDTPAWQVKYVTHQNQQHHVTVGGEDELGAFIAAVKTLRNLEKRTRKYKSRGAN